MVGASTGRVGSGLAQLLPKAAASVGRNGRERPSGPKMLFVFVALSTTLLLVARKTLLHDIGSEAGASSSAGGFASGSLPHGGIRSGSEDNEILSEENVKGLNLNQYPTVWNPPHESESRREQVTQEYELDKRGTNFKTLGAFEELIGDQCPALRHCSHKTSTNLQFGGGLWTAVPHEGPDARRFHPHDCWLYHFSGSEQWTDTGRVKRVGLLIDSDPVRSPFRAIADRSQRFRYMQVASLSTLQDELTLQTKIGEFVSGFKGDAPVSLTLVFNVVEKRKELGLVRKLLRLANMVDVENTQVIWASMPYYDLSVADEAILVNHEMSRKLEAAIRDGSSAVTIKRPSGAMSGTSSLSSQDRDRYVLPLSELKAKLADAVIVNVQGSWPETPDQHLEYFYTHSLHLPLDQIKLGWTPNVHRDMPLVVICRRGKTSIQAIALLRKAGYANVVALQGGLDGIRDGDTADLAMPLKLRDRTNIRGLDLFAPSFSTPHNTSLQDAARLLSDFASNALLNLMFQSEIIGASLASRAFHPCQTDTDCTSCLMVPGRVPSDRVTFETIKTYFHDVSVPTVIELQDSHRLWQGGWVKFREENRQATLLVRNNYKTVRTRQFERATLDNYLQMAHILRKTKDGRYEETHEPPEGNLPVYAGNNKLSSSSMRNFHFRYPHWVRKSSLQRPAMWLGPKNSLSSLHVDHSNRGNLAYQVLGSKKWHLFPPRSSPFMYSHRVGIVHWSSIIDPSEYNGRKAQNFPDFVFGICDSMTVDVNENEMLYNPDGWWHVVYNTDASLMLNFWLKTETPRPNKN